jgi:hypothetical protein
MAEANRKLLGKPCQPECVKQHGCHKCQHEPASLHQQWVTGLGLIEYLVDEVYWSLDLIHMLNLLALDDYGRADHPVGCHDVE